MTFTPSADPAEDLIEEPRADLASAIENSAGAVQELILGPCRVSLDLVHAYLPRNEQVAALLPVSAKYLGGSSNCLLILTERRLLFVAPAPQALSWPLKEVTKFQHVAAGPVSIHACAGEYMMGADAVVAEHGNAFEELVKRSVTAAILRG